MGLVSGVKQSFWVSRKKYLFVAFVLLLGFALGAVLCVYGEGDAVIYSAGAEELDNIIIGEYQWWDSFSHNLTTLLLAVIILFAFSLTKVTFPLDFVYLAYQGYLFGSSTAGIILENGIRGALSALFIVLPINLLNYLCLVQALVTFWGRLLEASDKKQKLMPSLRGAKIGLMLCVLFVLVASLVYSVIYPLLLRTVVVVNP